MFKNTMYFWLMIFFIFSAYQKAENHQPTFFVLCIFGAFGFALEMALDMVLNLQEKKRKG